jgi:Leucine-rich repeat (LRR) protein
MSRLEILPLVITRLVVEFSTAHLDELLYLHTVSKQFRRSLRHFSMVSHLHLELPDFLSAYYLGPLSTGVHSVSLRNVPRLESFQCLPALRVLDLSKCTFNSDLSPVALLNNLEMLDISGCGNIKRIYCLPASLRVLNAFNCSSLVHLPDHPTLRALDIRRCYRLEVPPSTPSLTALNADYSAQLFFPVGLQSLQLGECVFTNTDFLAPLAQLENLHLHIAKFGRDYDLTCLDALRSLTFLKLSFNLTDRLMQSVETLSQLRTLSLESKDVTDLGLVSISKLRNLTSLSLLNYYTVHMTEEGLSCLDLPLLTHLQLTSFATLTDLNHLSKLVNLENLSISSSYMLHDLRPLANFKKLHTLSLMYCDSVTSFAGLNGIQSLTELDAVKCWDLTRDGMWALLPCKLSTLSLNPHAHAQLGDSASEFRQQLKLQNPALDLKF